MRRTWDPAQHPQWLAFEAEGQLQIRPAQHRIAEHLVSKPGPGRMPDPQHFNCIQ